MNWVSALVQILPILHQAIQQICAAEGVTEEQAVGKLIDHLTPGKPNSPTLSGPAA
jgi:hypothetical protein